MNDTTSKDRERPSRVNGVQNVLDNLTKAVWGPEQTNYQFLAIQNGRIWETPTF